MRSVGTATSPLSDAIDELIAIFLEKFGDAAEFIHETGDAGVGGADHRASCFDAAENCVGQMLPRAGGAQEPAVVGDIDEQVRAFDYELSRQFSDCIFKANQRRDLHVIIR